MPVGELLYTNTIFGRFYLSQEEALHLRENKINLNIWVDYWKHSLSGREILNYEMASSGKSQESLAKILKIKSDKTLAGPNVGNDPVLVWGREAEKPFGAFLLFILKIFAKKQNPRSRRSEVAPEEPGSERFRACSGLCSYCIELEPQKAQLPD